MHPIINGCTLSLEQPQISQFKKSEMVSIENKYGLDTAHFVALVHVAKNNIIIVVTCR